MAEPLDPAAVLREQVAPRVRHRIDSLRAQIGRLQRELDDHLAAEVTVQLVLEGAGGGVWYLNVHGGEARVATLPEHPPLIRVTQTVADWEALAAGELAAGGAPTRTGDLSRTRIERLRVLRGALELLLATDAGERRVLVEIGDVGPAPRCTLRLRLDDARRLQRGELTPQAAFMQGAVKLDGDLAFAMLVGAALFG